MEAGTLAPLWSFGRGSSCCGQHALAESCPTQCRARSSEGPDPGVTAIWCTEMEGNVWESSVFCLRGLLPPHPLAFSQVDAGRAIGLLCRWLPSPVMRIRLCLILSLSVPFNLGGRQWSSSPLRSPNKILLPKWANTPQRMFRLTDSLPSS